MPAPVKFFPKDKSWSTEDLRIMAMGLPIIAAIMASHRRRHKDNQANRGRGINGNLYL